jgi:hypothetical protein
MEAARTSETSVEIPLRTRQYIPEDSELCKICLAMPKFSNNTRKRNKMDPFYDNRTYVLGLYRLVTKNEVVEVASVSILLKQILTDTR